MFAKAQSKEKPLAVENVGNNRYIIRQNIEAATDEQGETFYTYDEYLKIFCGNSDAAEYWWKKEMQRLEEEQKYGH